MCEGGKTDSSEENKSAMNLISLLQVHPPRTPTILGQSWKMTVAGSRRAHFFLVRSGGETAEPSPKGTEAALGGFLGKAVDELLKREENLPLLEGLDKASRRVETARAALADIERRETESLRKKNLVLHLQSQEIEIAETQKELSKVRAMVEESEQSLTLASLPLSAHQATSLTAFALHTAIVFITSALFGVTFRYTIRGDIDNLQLKTGTSAAFGFVKGLAELEAGKPLELNAVSFGSHFIDGVISVSENFFIFLAAAIALDFCFKFRLLSTFPIRE
ncbi:hypothetical protein KSP39_PZI022434 [Platanthera zijinensis]|uniref:Uncharacterized protein n=1 Tax=Platanthera zijinensis TaxID=2320716 RepID=A0AAP0AVP0_9ASPA